MDVNVQINHAIYCVYDNDIILSLSLSLSALSLPAPLSHTHRRCYNGAKGGHGPPPPTLVWFNIFSLSFGSHF